jgi:hypothetical protein
MTSKSMDRDWTEISFRTLSERRPRVTVADYEFMLELFWKNCRY